MSNSIVKYSGSFPWGPFNIHIDNNKIVLGWSNPERFKLNDSDYGIVFHSFIPESNLKREENSKKNIINCIAEYSTYLNNIKENIVYVSTHCFHNYSHMKYHKVDMQYDGMIVANNTDRIKRRTLLSKLKEYKIVSFGAGKNIKHLPLDFIFSIEDNIPHSDIHKFYNKSKISFTLSDMEGECRSSMESLLCGCPVLTTKAKYKNYKHNNNELGTSGGRVDAFGPHNSIFCEPTEDSVLESFEYFLKNEKYYDREFISRSAKLFYFNSKIQLLKILHIVVVKTYNQDYKTVLQKLKGSDFYNYYNSAINYYINNYL